MNSSVESFPSSPSARGALPVHLFTLVLNGMPFITYHIDVLKSLPFEWHWHIVEGVADLKYDTAWSLLNGGKIDTRFHRAGLSIDGTREYLDRLAADYPSKISLYRKPSGQFWDGKLEMVNAPLDYIKTESILWEIDADELWTAAQFAAGRQMFLDDPHKYVAAYWCAYFVGPRLILTTRNCYANNPSFEWQRTWRFRPGFFWARHEPPVLAEVAFGRPVSVSTRGVFSHAETEACGLVFQHFAYVLPQQLEFKESYYGYRDALAHWQRLQHHQAFPARLSEFFPWVKDGTLVGRVEDTPIKPLISIAPI
jgi:hypothetical protein